MAASRPPEIPPNGAHGPGTSEAPAVILNVNDDEATRYVVSRALRRAGYEVREACTAAEARVRALDRPDLILLDVNLPDGNGFDLCRQFRADPATSRCLIVHLSASWVAPEDRAAGLERGADGYLAFPVEDRELIATLEALLRTRRAEEQARLAAHRWQTTFDAIQDGVAVLDASGAVLQYNRALGRLLGLAPVDAVGRSLNRLFAERLGIEVPLAGPEAGTLAERHVVELQAGGSWFSAALDPVRSPSGANEGAVLTLVDISNRKALESELCRKADEESAASRRKDEFLAMLAHELRNPLSAMTASMHLLEHGGSESQTLRLRGIVNRQIRQLSRLVDDLLDVSRITHGKVELRRERVNPVSIVQQAVAALRATFEARRHTLVVELPSEPVVLEADPVRLEQVVANLLSNAAKYTDPGGRVLLSIRTESVGDRRAVRLEVSDNGCGIPAEYQAQVFEPFFQINQGLERKQGGLGVGLTLVKQLVELHEGSVSIQSAEGQGTRVVALLPLASAAPVAPSEARLAERTDGPLRVLLVEDNDDVREMLRAVLAGLGHQVEAAADGQRGLQRALAELPDVVILDIGLPGLSGYEVARAIRADPRGQTLGLVALTGYGRPEDHDLSQEAGFDVHLVKPVNPDRLAAALRSLAERERPARSKRSE